MIAVRKHASAIPSLDEMEMHYTYMNIHLSKTVLVMQTRISRVSGNQGVTFRKTFSNRHIPRTSPNPNKPPGFFILQVARGKPIRNSRQIPLFSNEPTVHAHSVRLDRGFLTRCPDTIFSGENYKLIFSFSQHSEISFKQFRSNGIRLSHVWRKISNIYIVSIVITRFLGHIIQRL